MPLKNLALYGSYPEIDKEGPDPCPCTCTIDICSVLYTCRLDQDILMMLQK
jgi:hypothetical protein